MTFIVLFTDVANFLRIYIFYAKNNILPYIMIIIIIVCIDQIQIWLIINFKICVETLVQRWVSF